MQPDEIEDSSTVAVNMDQPARDWKRIRTTVPRRNGSASLVRGGEDQRAGAIDELMAAPDALGARGDVALAQILLRRFVERGQRAARVAVEYRLHIPEFLRRKAVTLAPPVLSDSAETGRAKHVSDVEMHMRGVAAAHVQS